MPTILAATSRIITMNPLIVCTASGFLLRLKPDLRLRRNDTQANQRKILLTDVSSLYGQRIPQKNWKGDNNIKNQKFEL